MLVKVLGLVDFIVSVVLIMLAWKVEFQATILFILAGAMFLKGMFIFFGDIASGLDWITALVLVLAAFYHVPVIIFMIMGFVELQKSLFSFVA